MPNGEQENAAGPGRHDDRWRELVHRLHTQIDTIADEFVGRLRQLPPYSRGGVPLTLVREDAVLSYDYLLRQLAGLPAPDALAGVAARVGRDRARRQVPLEHLLRAVRLDFQVVWSVLQRLAGPDDLPVLVEHVEQIWSVVEDYTTQVQVCYMNETAVIARERDLERSALVTRLLDAPDLGPDDVEHVAIALGVSVDSSFLVAGVPTARQAGLRRAFESLVSAGRAAHWQERGRHALLIAEWRGKDDAAVDSVLGRAACGVAPIARSLAEVPRAAYVAQRVAEVMGPHSATPVRVRDVLGRLVAAGLGDLRTDVSSAVLGGLAGAPAKERERLLETVRTFLGTGTAGDAARALYCHRNTVLNRMNRFEELTGYDLAVPDDASAVFVALCCADL